MSSSSALPPPLPARHRPNAGPSSAGDGLESHELSLSSVVEGVSSSSAFLTTPAANRLAFPPTYAVVGIYRLITDPHLRNPIWAKTRNGTLRGLLVGFGWVFLTWRPQLSFVATFLMGTRIVKKITNSHGNTNVFGYNIPVSVYATVFLMSGQFWYILRFFLSKNIRIARERAFALTIEARNKPASFWGPYVEEWEAPPVDQARKARKRMKTEKLVFGWVGRFVLHKFILFPLNFVPIVGIVVSSMVKALGSARYLHQPYFALKKMTPEQSTLFVEERKWDYYAFGFAASLLESLPFVGMFFSVSNRIGAAMWCADIEKRQEAFRKGDLKPERRKEVVVVPNIGSLGRVFVKTEVGERTVPRGGASDLGVEGMPGALE